VAGERATLRDASPWKTEPVRILLSVIGIVLIVVGAVWAIQGFGTLKGSFMTGSPMWMWIGIACIGIGALLLVRTYLHTDGGSSRRR